MAKKFILISEACERRKHQYLTVESWLLENGLMHASSHLTADVIIFFTCSYKIEKVQLMAATIKKILSEKKPDAQLVVGGCMPKIALDELRKIFDGPIFTPVDITSLNDIIKLDKPLADKVGGNMPLRQIFNICWGCNRNCTYCAIRRAVGPLRSLPLNEVIDGVEARLNKHMTDIILIGDCLGDYGTDIGTNIGELLDRLVDVNPVWFKGNVRFDMRDVRPETFIQYFSKFERLAQAGRLLHLRIALQSGSERILGLMNRPVDLKAFCECVKTIRQYKTTLSSSVIVGFPTETDEDFLDTDKVLKECWFCVTSINMYTEFEGCESVNIHPKVPLNVITHRSNLLARRHGVHGPSRHIKEIE